MNKTPVGIIPGLEALTAGQGIDPDALRDRVLQLLLREENNLMQINDNNEVYVDLQLPAGITPSDDFPVGVTTGRILQADGRPQSGTILNWKTTSGDYVRFIYANDEKLYVDKGNGVWVELVGGAGECKVHIFEQLPEVDDDITYLYTSVVYDERYITVIETGEWHRYCWYVTGHEFPEGARLGHIYGIGYGGEGDGGGGAIDPEYVGQTLLDISFEDVNGAHICRGVTITRNDNSAYYNSTAPITPSQGMLRYDTANSVLKIYDGNNRQTI